MTDENYGSVYVYVEADEETTVGQIDLTTTGAVTFPIQGVVFDSVGMPVEDVLVDYVQASIEHSTPSRLVGVEVLNAREVTVDGVVVWRRET